MNFTMVQWLDSVRSNSKKDPLPVLSFPGIQLTGATVRDLVSRGDLQAQCMKAIADRYAAMASVSNMDLSVEAEAFGAKTAYSEDDLPSIIGRLIDSYAEAAKLVVPDIGTGRTGECVKAIELAVQLITDRPVFAG
jgi:uroporphyrinogen decarboxylase